MKRDIDLIRTILIELEQKESPNDWFRPEIEGYSADVVSYHIKILSEAGYIEARDLSTKDGFNWVATSLTWQGHEFLDAARNDTIWQKAKVTLGKKLSSISMEVLKSLLTNLTKQQLGL